MKIVFNKVKDIINKQKHKLSLAEAEYLKWDLALAWVDERFHYDEIRFISLVPWGDTILYTVYTECDNDNDETLHIISLRKADKIEVMRYVSEI